MSKLSSQQLAYIRERYRHEDDHALAAALGVSRGAVAKARRKEGLTRPQQAPGGAAERHRATAQAASVREPAHDAPRRITLRDGLCAGLAAGAAFWVYLRTLAPTVAGEDAGELTAAAYTLGVAHPPGYPLWCLLGHLFTYLPHGSVAWRVNLMSAFFAAAAVLVLCLLVLELTRSRWAALGAALAFAFSAEFWDQSVVAEVYALNAFLVVLCLYLLVTWRRTGRDGRLYAFAVVYGLSLGNHNTMHLLGPFFAWFVLLSLPRFWERWRLLAGCAGLGLAAAVLVHLYLPIRAAADPPVNWGNPSSWENFWDVVQRKQYTFAFTENPRTPARFVQQLGVFGGKYLEQFTPWLAALPVVGAWVLWRRDRFLGAFLLVLAAVLSLGLILILNFNLDKESIWVNSVFWIPAYLLAAVFLGAALADLGTLNLRGIALARLLPAAALAAAGLPLLAHYQANDKSRYYFARDHGLNILRTLEADAIYFPTADHATFPVLYLQAAEGMRPDIVLGNKYGYPEESLYADMPAAVRRRFRRIPSERESRIIEDWIIANTNRPVYFSRKRPAPASLPGSRIADAGLLYRVVRPGEGWQAPDYWAAYAWTTLDPGDTRGDYTAELVLADYHFALGRHLLAQDLIEEGLAAFEQSLAVAGANKEALNNLGSAAAEHGVLEEAAGFYERALETDPDYLLARRNLANLRVQQEDWRAALEQFKEIADRDAEDQETPWMLALCLRRLGQPDAAISFLYAMAPHFQDDPRLYRELGFVYLEDLRQPERARGLFAQSLALDPNQPDLQAFFAGTPLPDRGDEGVFDPRSLAPRLPEAPVPAPALPQLPGLPQLPDRQGVPAPPGPGGG